MEPTVKRCSKCGEEKPLDQFPIRIDRGRKPRSHCRPCHNARAKETRSIQMQTEWRLMAWYGLTVSDVENMAAAQDHKCAICFRAFIEVTRHVDHDHTTKVVRGLLCGSCNKGLGLFRDDQQALIRAADYLASAARHRSSAEGSAQDDPACHVARR